MTPQDLAERIRVILKAVEIVYGPNGAVGNEVKAAIISASVISLAMESNKEKESEQLRIQQ